MKKQRKDIWVIGFALFSMFFGAGNMIFPPYLGLETGTDWVTGFLSFTFADAGLALVAIVALVFGSGSLEGMLRPLGKVPSVLLSIACYLCIGPLLAIPRTAASTFELAIAPSFSFGPVPFSFLFFILVFAFTIRPNRVVDILGKILTPALYLSLLILIIRGIATPIGPIAETGFDGAFLSGLMAGYQTMDVIASVVFIILITNTLENRGYAGKEKVKITILSGVVATIGMMVVYGGLTYLGATATTIYSAHGISQANLLLGIVQHLMNSGGIVLLGITAALACLTTATGLTSSAAAYFSKLLPGKYSYPAFVAAICIFSAVVSNFGISTIVAFSAPILNIIYPAVLTTIALSFFQKHLHDNVFRFSTAAALITSTVTTLWPYVSSAPLWELPLSKYGFGWLLPTLLFGAAGWFVKPRRQTA